MNLLTFLTEIDKQFSNNRYKCHLVENSQIQIKFYEMYSNTKNFEMFVLISI